MTDLVANFGLSESALGHLTSAVQFGFITGTLIFALLTIADNTLTSLFGLRFMTGFFLAGIYPVGMKIAADYFQKGLGKSLGWRIGRGNCFSAPTQRFDNSIAVESCVANYIRFGGLGWGVDSCFCTRRTGTQTESKN